MVSVNCQLHRILNHLWYAAWRVPVGILLIALIKMERPTRCGWHHSLVSGEEWSSNVSSSLALCFLMVDEMWSAALRHCLLGTLAVVGYPLNCVHNKLFLKLLLWEYFTQQQEKKLSHAAKETYSLIVLERRSPNAGLQAGPHSLLRF